MQSQYVRRLASGRKKRLVQCYLMLNSTSFCSLTRASVIDENMAHELRGSCIKVSAALPRNLWLLNKSFIGLVDQRSGL